MQTTDLVVSLQCEKLWNIKAPAKLFVILTAQCMWWLEHFISHSWLNYFMQIHHELWSLFVNNEIRIRNRKPSNLSRLFITCWAELFPYAYFLHCSQQNQERELSKRANPPYMTLFQWKLFSIYSWFCVILRGYFKDATLLAGLSGIT